MERILTRGGGRLKTILLTKVAVNCYKFIQVFVGHWLSIETSRYITNKRNVGGTISRF